MKSVRKTILHLFGAMGGGALGFKSARVEVAGMQFLAASLGYAPPVPIEPEDSRAQLQRQFIAATAELAKMAHRIEALQQVRAAA